MYEKYYNLRSVPFQLTPDVKYFFGSKGHSRAIAHLIYGLSQGEGFIVITGRWSSGCGRSWTATPTRSAASPPRRSRVRICSVLLWLVSA